MAGIAARCEDDGAEGLGRHASIIRLGRALWQSPPLDASEKVRAKERCFQEGIFPPAAEAKKAAREAIKNQEDLPPAFADGSAPTAHYTQVHYQSLLDNWFDKLSKEKHKPNAEQMKVLRAVRSRLLQEKMLEKEGPGLLRLLRQSKVEDPREEPLRGFVHGEPGTRKSRVIE